MTKILTIVGARPQFVKAAVVSRAIKRKEGIEEVILHTGQHFDHNMSEVFFTEMDIPKPKYNLEINGLGHGAMTGQMLEKIEIVIKDENPDWVLVYGDTNSTLAGALAAKKLGVKVAHVEAGLRSFNMAMPEEINRILTDRISDILFVPTDSAVNNLKKEGFENINASIVVCGDVMLDAARFYANQSKEKSVLPDEKLKGDFILCTLHRAENTDNPTRLKSMVNALNTIHQNTRVVLPLHPRTKGKLKEFGLSLDVDLIDPVGYFDMIELLKNCQLVITDSGGLQKEAFFFKKNCVTLRDETEWVELVHNGFNLLAEAEEKKIIAAVDLMLSKSSSFDKELYGNGEAGEQIVDALLNYN